MTVNERLALARKTLKLTQREFAEEISVATGFVASMEVGDRKVNPRIMKLASSVFGVSMRWLETGDGDMFCRDAEREIEEIISLYKRLNPFFRKFILKQVKELLGFEASMPCTAGGPCPVKPPDPDTTRRSRKKQTPPSAPSPSLDRT